ncbi:MAG TPA: kelch repeat-containing protein [Candidatus Kapabacteria bacterium]
MKTMLRHFFVFVLMVVALSTTKAQWSEIPKLPVVLNWPMTAQLDGKIYVFGGVDNTASKSVYVYTPGATSWTKLSATMPKAKFGGYAAAVNGKIYIVGGMILSGTSFAANNETYEFDPVAGTFTPKAPIPAKLAFFAGAEVGGKVFVIGGATGTAATVVDSNFIQVYDAATNTWTRSASKPPYSTRYAASAVLNNKIYVMGGSKGNAYLDQAWRGTVSGDNVTWEELSSMPEALTRPSAGAANGKVVLTGGINDVSPIDYSNTYIYNEATSSWTTSYAIPVATYNAGQLFGMGNDLYFVGGLSNDRAFKFTVSDVAQPLANIKVSSLLINLTGGQTRNLVYSAQNLGVAPLTVTVEIPTDAQSWLSSVTPSSSIDPMMTNYIELSADAGSMPQGLYKTTVTLKTNDPAKAEITFDIKMYVLGTGIASQPTKVILEEGTGDWCGWCPSGHDIVSILHDDFAENFISLQYHGGSAAEPYQIPDGVKLLGKLNIQGYPNASIQRWFFPGQAYQMTDRGTWANYTALVLEESPTAPVTINVLSYKFDKSTREVTAKIELQRAHAIINDETSTIRLTTVVKESGIIGPQVDYVNGNHDEYEHKDIVRQMVPNELGAVVDFGVGTIIDGNIVEPGTKTTVDVSFVVDDEQVVNSADCDIVFIANVVKGASTLGPILQGTSMPLESAVGSVKKSDDASNISVSNYPNPATSTTNFIYSLTEPTVVTLAVYDVMGREVASLVSDEMHDRGTYEADLNVAKLAGGSYLYKLIAGGKVLSGTLTVVK